MRRRSFRRRLTIAAALAVAVAIALASAITYVLVERELRGQADDSLRDSAAELTGDRFVFLRESAPAGATEFSQPAPEPGQVLPAPETARRLVLPAPPLGEGARYTQLVQRNGSVIRPPEQRLELPGRERAAKLARTGEGSFFADGEVRGVHVRVLTKAVRGGVAVQVGRPVDGIDDALARLARVLAAVSLGGVGLAAGLALVVTRTALRPISELSEATEHVTRTSDLSRRIETASPDELGRLAGSFNTMLEALERSMAQQRRLVADASHELRTPLTSLRTNIEVLGRSADMPLEERERLLRSVVEELEGLTALVGDLVDLARDGREQEQLAEDVRLDEVAEEVVERTRRRHPELDVRLEAEPTVVRGLAPQLDRAVANLLDNAQKWSPAGGTVEVRIRDGELTVRDHGPGIAEEDLPYVFDRFYRSRSARGRPGSGLGLAIVRHVAELHGGEVSASSADGGGALLRVRLPSRNS